MRILVTSVAKKKEAKKLSKRLVKKGFAACVSSFSAKSIYLWQEKLFGEKEQILLIKMDAKFKKVAKFIRKHHSYETPEILSLKPKEIFKKYKTWIKKSTKKGKK
ncbi:divalent cation tolerance protein CutA [Campylobacter concisus]|uniref:divalent-cation tolerance protein CutA n=1 Tax=Campylobacter concisus TaxID=199 RepID=UPI00122C616C